MATTTATPSRMTTTGLTMGLVPGLEDELAQYGAIALAFGVAAVVLVVAARGRLKYREQRVPLEAPPRN